MNHDHAKTGSLATDTGTFKLVGGSISFPRACNFKPALEMTQCLLLVTLLLAFSPAGLRAVVTGSISGTAKDSSGAVIPGVLVQARNTQTGLVQTVQTDSVGFYNFPVLAVGQYDVSFQKDGFGTYRLAGLAINVDTALRVDAVLQVGTVKQEVSVQGTATQVDTRTTQTGEVIGGSEIENMPLNGRAFTDLLALQPGVVPMNVSMYGYLSPSGGLNAGVLSMSGQRDVNNGFMVNGANTVEGWSGGATIVPNLDSIAEFRIITSNAGAEYGNYSGGQVNVATKSGTNQYHGDAFEFLRNSDMDSRNFFSPTRGVFHQNQFGGTFGGPIRRDKAFFFVDYQGTRQVIGVDTGLELVPSAADHTGNLSDQASTIPAGYAINGQYFANLLAGDLGYPVTAGEPYFGCSNTANCVFPGYVIPQAAWSSVSPHILPLIPLPNVGSYFSTSAYPETLQDDKWSVRVDGNSRLGLLSAYYHNDPWSQLEPYTSIGNGSTVPGFPFQNLGKAQLLSLGATKSLGPTAVNQFTFSYMRNWLSSGAPVSAGSVLTEAAVGFPPPSAGGIFQYSNKYGAYPELAFNNYGVGPYSANNVQVDNTFQWQDDFSKVVGTHTLKFGANYHLDQSDLIASVLDNGNYAFNGTETGYDFADMLIGAPNTFIQYSPLAQVLRGYYVGAYGEDSWRVTHNLTLNYGLRWEATPYWADKNNVDPQMILGEQSKVFPGAPLGFVFPGDPGVPKHLARTRWNDLGPRLGLAYSPSFSDGFLHKLFGSSGQSSLRAGYGIYYTNIEGAASFDIGAPYHLFYVSSAPPLFATPFVTRASGQNLGQRFPAPVPPSNVSPSNPDNNINWSEFEPLDGFIMPTVINPSPYSEHVMVSFQRQFASNTLLNLSYVGTFGHHLLLDIDNNAGNPGLCLSLSQTSEVISGTPTCGPFAENGVFYPTAGGVVNGTRAPFGPLFSGTGYFIDAGNSDYHALEATLRHTAGRAQFLLSYTFSKAMDDGSAFGDQVLATHYNLFEGLSAFDITHNFTFSYAYELPFDKLFGTNNRATRGWKVSGITRFTTGVPVQISEPDDQSLLGNSAGGSPQSGSTDEPNFTPGKILNNTNPRDGQPYFNTSLFSQEPLGGQGTSGRRFFHGPGINNWDIALLKDLRLTESKKLEFRGELFNAFNHAQFYGSGAVNGDFDAGPGAFGIVTSAAAPRIAQVGAKFIF